MEKHSSRVIIEEKKKIIKCAIYTRKSSEEGLELEFNSLQAQREACEAYIKSQKHEGWQTVDKSYDDGGYSGGTLERPALKELLKDVKNGAVNIIVVYKIDRLTRSLMDFSKSVEILDNTQTSFVSITQQFNTTTSMGRLTLNMLLSFAQFEREVTGERIRDKYAASKKKGMWMGGSPPMGYYRKDKKIYPSQEEAAKVILMFNKYVKLGSVEKLKQHIEANNIKSQNDKFLSSSNIYRILANRAYIGEVGHHGTWYKGEHEGIISNKLFNEVQNALAINRVIRRKAIPTKSFLAGKIYDDKDNRMSPLWSSGTKGKKYRYYVSQAVIKHKADKIGKLSKVSAVIIEQFSENVCKDLLKDEKIILPFIENFKVENQKQILNILNQYQFSRDILKILLYKVSLRENEIEIIIYKEQMAELINALHEKREIVELPKEELKTEMLFNKQYKIAVIDNGAKIIIGSTYNKNINKNLIVPILRSFKWSNLIIKDGLSVNEIAKSENVTRRYVRQILNLSFLSPKITTAILQGKQPPDLTYRKLEKLNVSDWDEQGKFINT